MSSLAAWHNRFDGVQWRVARDGIHVLEGGVSTGPLRSNPPGSAPVTVRRFFRAFKLELLEAEGATEVPIELLLMTIATESGARWNAEAQDWTYPLVRKEPGYVSDEQTPHRISVGPMHLLLSTARAVLRRPGLTRAELADRKLNILCAARFIRDQHRLTGYDPILVAAAYNAGGVYSSKDSTRAEFRNRWNIRSWGSHLDRAAAWYGDACAVIRDPKPHVVGG